MGEYSVVSFGAYSELEAFFMSNLENVVRKFKFNANVTTDTMKVDEKTIDMVLGFVKDVTERPVCVSRGKIDMYGELNYIGEYLLETEADDFAIILTVRSNELVFNMFSDDGKKSVAQLEAIVEKIPVIKPEKDPHIVPFNFWNVEPTGGVHHSHKNITCPLVSEIEKNYPEKVMTDLKYLMGLEKPDSIGKIIIFSGPPGTGKTTAVRSLAREWAYKLGASVEIFLDPEELLASSGYMNKVILDVDSRVRFSTVEDSDEMDMDEFDLEDEPTKVPARERLRLVIIEDSADLISVNCRDKIGFSRFLNVTDGIIGQGLRHVFLITANEELGRLDPAVTRRGRCIKSVIFPQFSQKEGIAWLKDQGVENVPLSEVPEGVALSDLYAIKTGLGVEEEKKNATSFGFK